MYLLPGQPTASTVCAEEQIVAGPKIRWGQGTDSGMRRQTLRLETFLHFLLDPLAQLHDGRVQSIQQLRKIAPTPAFPRC